jgi:superfamily II DNA or RNA helicase
MISIRPYQAEALEAIYSNRLEGIYRQVIHLPTGAGKTVIFSSLIAQAVNLDPTVRVLVLAFSTDLLGQAKDKLNMISPGLSIGIVDMNNKEFDKQVVVSSVQSARQPGNLEKLKAQGFLTIVCDECHHFASDSARLVLNELGFSKEGCSDGKRLLLGFSATPFRTDSKGLGEVFDKIVYHRSIKEMIGDGYLCKPAGCKVVTDLNLAQIAIDNGDYSVLALSRLMNTDTINETVVRTYMEKAGVVRKTITFCTSIEHAETLSSWFRKFGIHSEAIHSNLDTDAR